MTDIFWNAYVAVVLFWFVTGMLSLWVASFTSYRGFVPPIMLLGFGPIGLLASIIMWLIDYSENH